MCSTYTWLDVLCRNHHGDLVNVVFFSENHVRVYHDLFNKKEKKKKRSFICPSLNIRLVLRKA